MKEVFTFYREVMVLLLFLCAGGAVTFGKPLLDIPNKDTTVPPPLLPAQRQEETNKTILVSQDNQLITFTEEPEVWVSSLSRAELDRQKAEWTRLKNAVYVTYPYAKIAGSTIMEINQQLLGVTQKNERKRIIKTKEKQLRVQFTEPLTNLSIYQGKVLMKLINRQTGNNCYEILKEFKGAFNARAYQTIAFFFGGNLKQDWDLAKNTTDRDIEKIVKEIDRSWYYTPY